MGCANYHGWLTFENSDRWIVRVPRTGFSEVPPRLVECLVESEYATLKFLSERKFMLRRLSNVLLLLIF